MTRDENLIDGPGANERQGEEYVSRSAPRWAWDLIDETLDCDSRSHAFDADLRERINRARHAMLETSETTAFAFAPVDEHKLAVMIDDVRHAARELVRKITGLNDPSLGYEAGGDVLEAMETVWAALDDYRENNIPEGDAGHDAAWGDLCEAMEAIRVGLGLPDPVEEYAVAAVAEPKDLPVTIETLSFNTGRLYSKEGQRIVAAWDGETVAFRDFDRMIYGCFPQLVAGGARITPALVMAAYDAGGYVNSFNMKPDAYDVFAKAIENVALTPLSQALKI